MRIGFRTAGFSEWPIDRALYALGGLGYDGVELCLEHPDCRPETLTRADAERLAQACTAAGLEVASVSYHGDFEDTDLRRANTVRALDLAPAFGADILIINGRRAEVSAEAQALAELGHLLDVMLPRAAELGVRIAIEPEPDLAVGSSEDMKRLLDLRRAPQLGVNLDVGHAFLTDADVCESVKALGSSIVHAHFEGMALGAHKHLLPGEGDIDLVAISRALLEMGYEGYCTIDLFHIADDPAGWAQTAIGPMRRIIADARRSA